jgi:hypothetical protein
MTALLLHRIHFGFGWKGGDSGDSAEKQSCSTKNHGTDLTPTGLLMEGDFTNYAGCNDSITMSAPRPE